MSSRFCSILTIRLRPFGGSSCGSADDGEKVIAWLIIMVAVQNKATVEITFLTFIVTPVFAK